MAGVLHKITTLCYIRRDNQYLMLLRNKKENDENEGKWIGIGGKLEKGETPDECVRREAFEETGLRLTQYSFKGVISFINERWGDEYMFLYEATAYTGEVRRDCPEGELRWIPFDQILDLPLWEGDRAFLGQLMAGKEQIRMKLVYDHDVLTESIDETCVPARHNAE